MLKPFAAAACLAACMITVAQAAPTSAVTFDPSAVGLLSGTGFYSSRGYEFNVTQAGLSASHLGVFDPGANGLADSHLVGLWTTGGTLLASATVASGTSALLRDSFRYVDIPDVALSIGSYIVAAVYDTDSADGQANFSAPDVLTAPGITFVRPRYGSCCTPVVLPFPSNFFDSQFFGSFGGTLMVDDGTNAVPEPSGVALALSALVALTQVRRGRR